MTEVYFVRHAQSDPSWSEDATRPLTPAGMNDRFELVKFMNGRIIDSLYSSPYLRSIETIRPLAADRRKKITEDVRLRERKSGADALVSGNLEKRWADFSYSEEGGESLGSVQERNIECLQQILKKEENRVVVIGTHGTALSTVWNFYDSDFGVGNFLELIDLMPCVVRFSFEGTGLVDITKMFEIQKTYEGKNNLKSKIWKRA